MTFTIEFTWWAIPLAITVISLAWALLWPVDDSGCFGELIRLFMLIPALFITAAAWIVAAIVK